MALWWVYFLVPSGQALHEHRERAFRWGYGHAIAFAALAALGALLEVVADQLKAAAHTPAVSATYAIALVAAPVALYLLSVAWMSAHVTRHGAALQPVWLASVGVLAAVVAAVALGLPLPWALPALTLAPLCVIVRVEHGAARRPELFAIR
jgi:hypothetical protein